MEITVTAKCKMAYGNGNRIPWVTVTGMRTLCCNQIAPMALRNATLYYGLAFVKLQNISL